MAVLYEVNLCVNIDIAENFLTWLRGHVAEILTLPGFVSAELFEHTPDNAEEGKKYWVAQYRVKDNEAMEDYFANHAPKMRQDGLSRFPNQFSATRRILHSVSI